MAHIIRGRSGNKNYTIVLRNPAEKAKRYATQIKTGVIKETGKKLSPTDKAWRAGYLSARQDSANAFKAKRRFKKKVK